MNNLDKTYQSLLKDILDNGVIKEDRTGTGTLSVFGRQIRHSMSEGYPLLTTKKMAVKAMITELKWFLKGDTNIKYLVDNGCHIWDGDAYKNYDANYSDLNDGFVGIDLSDPRNNEIRKFTKEEFINKIKTNDEFAKKWGELGPIYGKQWRKWKTFTSTNPNATKTKSDSVEYIDQITNLINDLKTNPDSRRLMVSAWNVGELNQMVLPPCHYGFQVYTKEMTLEERLEWNYENTDPLSRSMDYFPEHLDSMGVPKRKISLMWNQRSVDTLLGLPFNIASYGLILILIAKEVNMVPDELIGNLGDTHLYLNHLTQAKEQIKREPYSHPKMEIKNCDIQNGEFEYELLNYISHPKIEAPLSN
jgi:thymidylate synthase